TSRPDPPFDSALRLHGSIGRGAARTRIPGYPLLSSARATCYFTRSCSSARKGVAMHIAITPRGRAVPVLIAPLLVLLVSGPGLTHASGEPAAGEPLWVSTYTGPENGADIA